MKGSSLVDFRCRLLHVQGAQIAQIAFSPGFAIALELMMDWLAITGPQATLTGMKGGTLRNILAVAADPLFNFDPHCQQGGDRVRLGASHAR